MNKLKSAEKLYHGFCWIPRIEKHTLDFELQQFKESNNNIDLPKFTIIDEYDVKPPTLIRSNEFTWAF